VGQTLQMYLNPNAYDAEYVSFESLETRNANGERLLQFKAFNQEFNLRLQPAEIFAPNYRYMEMETLSDGKTAYFEKEQVIVNGGRLYSIADSEGSLYIMDKDSIEVNGIINDQLVVMPVSSSDSTNADATHVIYKKKAEDVVDRINDYIKLFESRVIEEVQDRQAPAEVTVKLLVVFDNINTMALKASQRDIESYAAIFWNSVQRRYAEASNPRVKLAIAGIVAMSSASAQPFVTSALASNNPKYVEGSKLLDGFRDYVKANHNGKYDAAIFHTALDGFNGETGSNAQAGLAFVGTACKDDGAGYGEDKVPFFSGVNFIAHELGHILNSNHDGDERSEGCTPNDGYLMSPILTAGSNQWHFSSCSLNVITKYLGSNEGSCTWKPPTKVDVRLSEILPGFWNKGKSLDEVCAAYQGDGWTSYVSPDTSVCKTFFCQNPSTSTYPGVGAPPEGTPCGYNKMCSSGLCEPSSVPTLDQQCAAKGGQAANVFDPSACSNLKCSNGQSAGAAKDGTSCGLAGICKNQQCVGQVTTTLDSVCQTTITNVGFKAAQTDSEKQSCSFRCVKKGYGEMAFPVPDQLPCGPRSVCQNQQCVAI